MSSPLPQLRCDTQCANVKLCFEPALICKSFSGLDYTLPSEASCRQSFACTKCAFAAVNHLHRCTLPLSADLASDAPSLVGILYNATIDAMTLKPVWLTRVFTRKSNRECCQRHCRHLYEQSWHEGRASLASVLSETLQSRNVH